MESRDKPPREKDGSPTLRFEATLGPATRAKALAAAAELALDRLPDVNRRVRLLLSAEDARKLLDLGFEVHLLAARPVAPLDPSLILTDKQSRDLMERRLKGIPRKGGE